MRLVIVSDTHSRHAGIVIPDGDVFVHCGDLSNVGRLAEIQECGRWIRALPHPRKIVIAGNHDFAFQRAPERARDALGGGIDYLEDSGITVDNVRFWGSPWSPWFFDWAFNLQRGNEIAAKWALIPTGTDVLITHGPPMGILDVVRGDHVGCQDLFDRIQLIRPAVHAFGHIHEGSGVHEKDETTFVNASICDRHYNAINPPRTIDL